MKLSTHVGVVWFVAMFGVALQNPSQAAASHTPGKSDQAALGALAGTAVPTSELGRFRGEGGVSVAVDTGTVTGNSCGACSTGTNTIGGNAISNNTGFTTVFQNSGNNSLFQSSTSIYISVH
jgi:hypothetical protein